MVGLYIFISAVKYAMHKIIQQYGAAGIRDI